jgi:uncharacterized Zn-binding protein involved in type VI secretion
MGQKPVARLGDISDHGGVIISSGTKYRDSTDGKLVARVGDYHSCPIPGHGVSAIITGSPKVRSEGSLVAAITSVTGCGATIIAGSKTTTVPMGTGGSGDANAFILDNDLHDVLNGPSTLG